MPLGKVRSEPKIVTCHAILVDICHASFGDHTLTVATTEAS